MSHPDEGLIHAWLDGELDAAESARVEALVTSDPAWAAAAAEARGLIAATSRIVGALDGVPGHVLPKTVVAPRRTARRWMLRAAAVVVLVGGSAVVLNRTTLNPVEAVHGDGAAKVQVPTQVPTQVPAQPPAQPTPVAALPATPAPKVAANAPAAESKSNTFKKELFAEKQESVTVRDKDVATRAVAASAAAPSAMAFAQEQRKITRPPLSCFEQITPVVRGDSARSIIRLAAAALDDSIRLEKLTLRGDTLAGVHGPLIAVRVQCQAP